MNRKWFGQCEIHDILIDSPVGYGRSIYTISTQMIENSVVNIFITHPSYISILYR